MMLHAFILTRGLNSSSPLSLMTNAKGKSPDGERLKPRLILRGIGSEC